MARVRITKNAAAGRGYLKSKIDNRVTLYFFHDRDTIVDDKIAREKLASSTHLDIIYDDEPVKEKKKEVKIEIEVEPEMVPKEQGDLKFMSKDELEAFARERFDYELDKRKSFKKLLKEVKGLFQEE